MPFKYNEQPSGSGQNFTLQYAPNPAFSLILTRNGQVQTPGQDFSILLNAITLVTPLQVGELLVAQQYEYIGSAPFPYAYTTIQDVRNATGMQDSSKISDLTVEAKIAYACSTINSYLITVYALPLASPVPKLITFLALEIASAMLYIDEYGEETQNLDKGWKKKLDAAFAILEEIKNQNLKLLDDITQIELPRSDHLSPLFTPNDITSDPCYPDSTAPKITMNMLP